MQYIILDTGKDKFILSRKSDGTYTNVAILFHEDAEGDFRNIVELANR